MPTQFLFDGIKSRFIYRDLHGVCGYIEEKLPGVGS